MKRRLRSALAPFAWTMLVVVLGLLTAGLKAADSPPRTPLVRAVDLDVDEAQEITLADGANIRVNLRKFVDKLSRLK